MIASGVDYKAHGLLVRSDLLLRLQPAAIAGMPDMTLRRGADRAVPTGNPPGELLAEVRDERNRTFYSIGRDQSRTIMRYPGLCEFVGDRDLRDVVVHAAPGAAERLLSVVAAGALLAMHLILRGELVLHASAVRVVDSAVAFIGASGMGKSTLATLLCADGHLLVADDVVRVCMKRLGARPVVFPGSIESRLRPGSSALADAAPAGAVHQTADGRIGLRLEAHDGPPIPLAACVVPFPNHHIDEIVVSALSKAQGLRRLLQFPRILGWVERGWPVRNFEALADLVNLVPVFEAQVPWGPPFRPDVTRKLCTELGLCETILTGSVCRPRHLFGGDR